MNQKQPTSENMTNLNHMRIGPKSWINIPMFPSKSLEKGKLFYRVILDSFSKSHRFNVKYRTTDTQKVVRDQK